MSRLQDITTFTDTEIDDLDYFWINEIKTDTATISIASPCIVTKTAHGLEVGNKISFTTTGALPTGLVASTQYFIISDGFGANSFKLSTTFGGTAINTSGTQSGVHTYTAYVSKKMSGQKLKALVVPSTPSSEVAFDKLTPTTGGVVFTPNTPSTTDILYYSTVDGSTWIYNGTAYVSKVIPNSTEWNLDSSFNDAGSNKTSAISRNGEIKVRNDNTLLSRFTQILSFGIQIVSDVYAQITQTAVSDTTFPLTRMARRRGTITSQTNALSGDTLGMLVWNGSNNDSAKIFAQATENHSGNIGTSLYFQTAQTGSSGLSTAFWIDGTAKLNVMLGLKCDYATASTLSGFDASKNLISLSTSTYPSLTELAYVKGVTSAVQTQIDGKLVSSNNLSDLTNTTTARTNLGLGSLATQSGTFSGTSSGTNTGDQTYFDARVQSVTSSATVTPVSTNDLVKITAQATGLTLANPTGTFTEGQALMIRIKDNGTARGITFDTNYRAIGITLPTTTVISKTMYLGIIYNSTDTKWDIIGYNLQA